MFKEWLLLRENDQMVFIQKNLKNKTDPAIRANLLQYLNNALVWISSGHYGVNDMWYIELIGDMHEIMFQLKSDPYYAPVALKLEPLVLGEKRKMGL